jgi:integration host factor subunit alpha
MTLTKLELADNLANTLEIGKLTAKQFVDLVFEEMRQALEQGEHVKLSGLGNFELRDKPERPGRNPKTGEDKTISARRVVTFKAGQKFKANIRSKMGTVSPHESQDEL